MKPERIEWLKAFIKGWRETYPSSVLLPATASLTDSELVELLDAAAERERLRELVTLVFANIQLHGLAGAEAWELEDRLYRAINYPELTYEEATQHYHDDPEKP